MYPDRGTYRYVQQEVQDEMQEEGQEEVQVVRGRLSTATSSTFFNCADAQMWNAPRLLLDKLRIFEVDYLPLRRSRKFQVFPSTSSNCLHVCIPQYVSNPEHELRPYFPTMVIQPNTKFWLLRQNLLPLRGDRPYRLNEWIILDPQSTERVRLRPTLHEV